MAGRRQRPWFAGLILAALVLTALFAPYLAPHSPTEGDITRKSVPPVWKPIASGATC
jgi:ABC-type antimicrobial peptide transport system permease subunit